MPRRFSNSENNQAIFAAQARLEKLRYELIEGYGRKKFNQTNYKSNKKFVKNPK